MNMLKYVLYSVFLVYINMVNGLNDTVKLSYNLISPSCLEKVSSPPIILLHGILDSKKTWKYVAPPLAEITGRLVYAVDHRNHGESPRVEEFNFDIMVEDLNRFLAEQSISKAILIGHSMGGKIAMKFAFSQPHRVEKLIVEEMSTEGLESINPAFVVLIRQFRKSLTTIPPGADEETLINVVKEYFRKNVPEIFVPRKALDVNTTPVNIDGVNSTWQANLDLIEEKINLGFFGHEISGLYEGDALFIYGTRSFIGVQTDKGIKEYFPRAEFLGFEDATHLLHHEFPEDFVREVIRFIIGIIKPYSNCERYT